MHDVIRLEGDTASVIADDWALPAVEGAEDSNDASARVLIPFAEWASAVAAAPADARLGVLLPNDIDPTSIAPFDPRLALIAIEFPKFTDGRGYSIATMVRRLGYAGELRAVGEVLRDQLAYLRRVGFDSFAIAAGHDAAAAVEGLFDFSDGYQATITQREPAFRRQPGGFGTVSAA